MKKIFWIIIAVLVIAGAGAYWAFSKKPDTNTNATTADLIRVESPRPGESIKSPLFITGEAKGSYFFEATFPVVLVNWDGLIVAQGVARAKGDWMTTDFVPFESTLTFTTDKNAYSNKGTLIFRKDNPSGLPEHDASFEVPVIFGK